MSDHDFCRLLLKHTRDDLTSEQRKRLVGAWSYTYNDGCGELHVPKDGFYWYGSACCAWAARTNGINDWLQKYYPEADDEQS
jgi:hypothetical protein